LVIELDSGISLFSRKNGSLQWQYPFEAIRATGDDTQRFLWIDFGPPMGEIVILYIMAIFDLIFVGLGTRIDWITKSSGLYTTCLFGNKSSSPRLVCIKHSNCILTNVPQQ
jgi:hypothetical protein